MVTEKNIVPVYSDRLKILHIVLTKYGVDFMTIKATVNTRGLNYATFLLCSLYRPVLSVHDYSNFITYYIFSCDYIHPLLPV
jgi:hypothetical protein